tara:strand:+ start:20220 stop:20462 length:243 start_codon:yes stop_codon:yes gene_type:complete
MRIKLTYSLERNRVSLVDFVKKNDIKSYKELEIFCKDKWEVPTIAECKNLFKTKLVKKTRLDKKKTSLGKKKVTLDKKKI